MKTDTIAAIATAMAPSGIGIIRLSGEESFLIMDQIFRSKREQKKLSEQQTHTIHYGYIYDGEDLIDEVMVLLMRAPHSYTKEDTIEIDCHGGVFVMKKILETVIKYGARPADPGEFTKRAFLNGRIDLSQAESVIDVIHSQNSFALKSSLQQLKGSVKKEIVNIREIILHEIAFIESALDDPEHISLEGYPQQLLSIVKEQVSKIQKLIASSDNGRMLSEGIKTVIVGKPNAGKSSLLNCMMRENRAIVTDVAGTTRDVLEERLNLNGVSLTILDTAGIRETTDIVEKIGVERAKENIEDADLILYVVDASVSLDESDYEIMKFIQEKKVIVLLNKSDLETKTTLEDVSSHLLAEYITFSAKTEFGLEELENKIIDLFFEGNVTFNNEVYITNIRHKNALMNAEQSLSLVIQSICDEMPEDLFSIDLLNAYESLGLIIGESVEDDLVNEIFSKFCMGK